MCASSRMTGKEIAFAYNQKVKDEAEHFKATCFIIRVDETRFKKLLDDLERYVYRGRDQYPKTVTATYNLLGKESGVYNTNNNVGRLFQREEGNHNCQGGGRSGEHSNFMFPQTEGGCFHGQGSGCSGCSSARGFYCTNTGNSDKLVPGTDG